MIEKLIYFVSICFVLNIFLVKSIHASHHIIDDYVKKPLVVGSAKLTYFLFDIYDAKLYASNGKWRSNKPYAITLKYLRDFDGKDMAKVGVEQFEHQGIYNRKKLNKWYKYMLSVFPNVKEGSKLIGIRDEHGHAVFYYNNKKVGHIKDKEFTSKFFDIWLGRRTSQPDLRAQLLGY